MTTKQSEAPDTVSVLAVAAKWQPTQNALTRMLLYVVQHYTLVIVWILISLLFVVLMPKLNLGVAAQAVLGQQTPVIFLGLAVVITMSVGEFDLSFASVFGLAASVVPSLVMLYGWPFGAAVVVAIALAVAFGAINALLVVSLGVNSVVVTLGTGSVAIGLAYLISRSTSISGMPAELSQIALFRVFGLPVLFWYGIILVGIAAYVMLATPLGRNMLFVGSNPVVARLAGIPVQRVRFGSYVIAGLLCGLAGVVISAGVGGFNAGAAMNNMMPTFAAVFLGTIAVVPGRFNPIGMLIAAYFLLTGVFGLQLLGLSGWVTDVFYGMALVVAVSVSLLVQRRIRG